MTEHDLAVVEARDGCAIIQNMENDAKQTHVVTIDTEDMPRIREYLDKMIKEKGAETESDE